MEPLDSLVNRNRLQIAGREAVLYGLVVDPDEIGQVSERCQANLHWNER